MIRSYDKISRPSQGEYEKTYLGKSYLSCFKDEKKILIMGAYDLGDQMDSGVQTGKRKGPNKCITKLNIPEMGKSK